MPSSPRRDDHGTTRLVLMTVAAAIVAAALALRLAVLTGLPTGFRPSTLLALPVEGLVEVGALALGLLAATWLALSATVALGCVAAHRLGRRWAAGEAVLARVAPTVVRRLARSAVGLGVGTGLALAPSAALAADDGAAAQDAVSPTAVVDLGWQPTPMDAGGADEARTDGTTSDESGTDETGPGGAGGTEDSGGPGSESPTVPADRGGGDPAGVAEAGDTADSVAVDTTDTVDTGTAAHDGPSGDAAAGPRIAPAPAGDASVVARDLRGTPNADDGTVVVLRGDTLWDIAASHLAEHGAPGPSDAQVLEEMTRWHQANRDVVGPDPDVILPGQVLRPPG